MYLRKEKNPETNFMEAMKQVKKILVIRPNIIQNEQAVQLFLNKLNQAFTNCEVSTFEISMLRKSDRNWLGVPNSSYLNQIQDEKYDLLIDLNPEQDRICTYLGALSEASMRIHLSEGNFDKIYNLQIRTDKNAPLSTRYDTLIIYLSKLKNSNLN